MRREISPQESSGRCGLKHLFHEFTKSRDKSVYSFRNYVSRCATSIPHKRLAFQCSACCLLCVENACAALCKSCVFRTNWAATCVNARNTSFFRGSVRKHSIQRDAANAIHRQSFALSYSIVYRGGVSVRKRTARQNTCCAFCFMTRSMRKTWTTQKTHA